MARRARKKGLEPFLPIARRPVRVAVLASERAPGLASLLADRLHDSLFKVVCIVSSEPRLVSRGLADALGVPVLLNPIRDFEKMHGTNPMTRAGRRAYDGETARLLVPFDADLLLLVNYPWLLTRPLLGEFPERIFNVQASDLIVMTEEGKPRYQGRHAVRDALAAGEHEIRATVHLVTARGTGPALLRSWHFAVDPGARDAALRGDEATLRAHGLAVIESMFRAAWGPLLRHTIRLLATHAVRLRGGRFVLGGESGPWELTRWGRVLVTADRYALRERAPSGIEGQMGDWGE